MEIKSRVTGGRRWRAGLGLLLAWAALAGPGGLAGCEDKEARKQVNHDLSVVRGERDELARQLDKAHKDREMAEQSKKQLANELRLALAEGQSDKSDRDKVAGEAGKVQADLAWLQTQYNSLKDKNQVLESQVTELRNANAALRRQLESGGGGAAAGAAPGSQPDIMKMDR